MVDILNGLAGKNAIKRIYSKRFKDYDYQTVRKGTEKPDLDEGWTILAEHKLTTRLQKLKPADRAFEDKVWCVLAKMEFEEMNEDRSFKIPISENTKVNPKQVDVFAAGEGIAIVVECKSADSPTQGSFRGTILEINGYREEVIRSICKHYGRKIKVGWILATKNLIWNEPDKELAKDNTITTLMDSDLEYYDALVNHLGPAAKYQFLADVFATRNIPGLEIRVPAVRGRIGNSKFYSFALEPSRLLPIAFIAHRSKRDKDTLVTYQRMLNKKRLKSIKEYIEKEDGLFPNSIIVNFHTDKTLRFDKTAGNETATGAIPGFLYLPNKYKTAWIIDGQHRLYGFSGTAKASEVTIPVIAFENLDPSTQAKMFVDINSKQVKVSKNLLNDLYADLLWNSDYEAEKLLALGSKVVSELGVDLASPLRGKIKSSTEAGKEKMITITTVADSIKKNALLGHVNRGSDILLPGPLYDLKEPRMENSLLRAKKVTIAYLNEFKNGVPEHWSLGDAKGGYLCTNNGLAALFMVLKEIVKQVEHDERLDGIEIRTEDLMEGISKYSAPIVDFFKSASFQEIQEYRSQYGVQGQRNCALGMMEMIQKTYSEFKPAGLDKYTKEKYSMWNEKARDIVPDIQITISNHVLSEIKRQHGLDGEKWWYDGIPEKTRLEILGRQQTDPDHGDKEQYFDLIHYEKIISSNWTLFKDAYGFRELGNSKERQLSWFDRLNKIRNKTAHPEKGPLSQEEYQFLVDLLRTLRERLGG